MQQAEAYDFALFEPSRRPAAGRSAAPQLKAVAGGKPKADRPALANAWLVLLAAGILALVILLIQSKATIAELNTETRRVQSQLTEAKSTYSYLSSELERRTGVASIEASAAELGLMKVDESQITYVRLEGAGVLTASATPVQQFTDTLQSGLLSLMEALDP